MTAERPSPAVIEEWVARSWDRRPPFTYEALVEMWREEQASRAKAHEKDYRSKQLDELRRRVGQLEALLGPHGKRLVDELAKGFGQALGQSRTRERKRLLAEVEKRGFVTYGGVWDESTDYARGALVTHGGSAWVALTPAEKGLRPGKAPAWRLAVKGESGKAPVAV
jgi:hypothetical protein